MSYFSSSSSDSESDIENIEEYTPLILEKNKIKQINFELLIKTLPKDVIKDTTLEIKIYSNENITLSPCEKKFIETGIKLDVFMPFTHNISFEGYRNTLGLEMETKYILPMGEELKIEVSNYGLCNVEIRKGMPLGKLILSSN